MPPRAGRYRALGSSAAAGGSRRTRGAAGAAKEAAHLRAQLLPTPQRCARGWRSRSRGCSARGGLSLRRRRRRWRRYSTRTHAEGKEKKKSARASKQTRLCALGRPRGVRHLPAGRTRLLPPRASPSTTRVSFHHVRLQSRCLSAKQMFVCKADVRSLGKRAGRRYLRSAFASHYVPSALHLLLIAAPRRSSG